MLKRSGVLPSEAICIGDEIRDADAARAVGIAFGAVAWGFTDVEALRAHEPEMVFVRMEEIAEQFTAQKSEPVL